MKTCLLLLASLTVGAGAFGQGTVAMANNAGSQVRYGPSGTAWSNATVVPITVSSAELLWAELSTPTTPYSGETLSAWLIANPGWMALPSSTMTIGPVPGRFSGGIVTASTATPGPVIQMFVIGWYTPSGGPAGSFDVAYAIPGAYVGFSDLLQVDTGNPLIGESAAALYFNGYTGNVLNPVPEPGLLALAGLGAVALWTFRRRR